MLTIIALLSVVGAATASGVLLSPSFGWLALAVGLLAYGLAYLGLSSKYREANGEAVRQIQLAERLRKRDTKQVFDQQLLADVLTRNSPRRRTWTAQSVLFSVACIGVMVVANFILAPIIAPHDSAKSEALSSVSGVWLESIGADGALVESDGVLRSIIVEDISGAAASTVHAEYEILDRSHRIIRDSSMDVVAFWVAASLALVFAVLTITYVPKTTHRQLAVTAWTRSWRGSDPQAAYAAMRQMHADLPASADVRFPRRHRLFWVATVVLASIAVAFVTLGLTRIDEVAGDAAKSKSSWALLSDSDLLAPGTQLAEKDALAQFIDPCRVGIYIRCERSEVALSDGDVIDVYVVHREGESLLLRDLPPVVNRQVELLG